MERKKYHCKHMRFSVTCVANGAARAVIVVLICAAIVFVYVLGSIGLVIVGGITALVCVRAEMDQEVPICSAEVFKAQMDSRGSPEERAAMMEERHAFQSPLRFYRRCGIFLTIVGVAGVFWQQWRFGSY